ncbi:MAG: 50S ribosomal protein L6 [Candidatus Cloacimonadaceae bacterium]|nr:50S ribosomal protein L6 [Candidatus Cloacimonadaceae bacterium]
MSRIGKAPIKLTPDVKVEVKDGLVSVKGPLGELSYQLMPGISVNIEESVMNVLRTDDSKSQRALHGLSRALIQNMVTGVSTGYLKTLTIIGTGYSSEVIGPWLRMSLGYSHDIVLQIPDEVQVEAQSVPRSKGTRSDLQSIIRVKGIDKQVVGQFASEVRACRPPENYKGKGVRYQDEHVTIKAGKAGSK